MRFVDYINRVNFPDMKPLFCTCLLLVISFVTNAQEAKQDTWVTNGPVSSITRGDGKVFLGGTFNWVGPSHGSGGAVFNSTLTHDSSYPLAGSDLLDAEDDDDGGWYIASHAGIVHLKSDKTIEELGVHANDGFITTLEKVGNVLYFGGSFTNVDGNARGNIAAYDLTSGTLTTWNPNATGSVEVIVASGATIYAGGRFTSIGGQARIRIAALDASTGLATSWNANIASGGGFVQAIALDASAVYFGGSFSNVGGGTPSRTNFAAVNTTTGALLPFNPRPNSFVYNLLLDGTTLYMAGNFSQVAATTKDNFAALNVNTGAFTSMTVTFNNNAEVNSLAIDGQKLFLGGSFTKINGEDRPRLAAVDKTTGALEPMDAGKISDAPYRLVISSGKILAIADHYFIGVAGEATGAIGAVALDEDTGQPVLWTPEMPAQSGDEYLADVELHYQDNRVYFLQKVYRSSDGYYETKLGAVDATDGSISTFEVSVDNVIEAWTFSEDALYLAGQFTEVNGETRSGFAAIELATGNLLPWTISFVPDEQAVNSIAVHNNVLYVAGEFYFNDGEERQNLAAWNATTGALTDWAPEYFSDFGVPRIGAVTDTRVYIIGNGIYTVDATTGETGSGWLALFNEAQIYSMAISGSAIYVGGYSASSDQVATLARLDLATGQVTGIQPVLNDIYASEGSAVTKIAVSDTKLFVGGDFSLDMNGIRRPYYAEYLLSSPGVNMPPQIEATTVTVAVGGIVAIDLEPLLSDPDNNLDLSTLHIKSQSSEHGASASLNELTLTLNYESVTFVGTDHITIGICDLLEECAEQELNIKVTGDEVIVHNAVSPNGDQKNDFLMLEGIESFGENKVTIFNRWGDLVFDVSDYNNTDRAFTGVNKNGNELPSGTYFYKIEYGTGRKVKNGYLSLKR
jgi:gliding motility-associated-like protein